MPSFDPFAQLKLLELQALDTHADQVQAKLRTLPERAAAIEVIKRVDNLRTEHATAVTDAADLKLEVAKAEADVEQVRARAARDQGLLDSGTISEPKQLTDLQHEVATLARRQSELEDVEIEILQKLEEMQQSANSLQLELTEAESAAQVAAKHADAIAQALETEKHELAAQRKAIAEQIPADLLKIYDKVRADRGGIAAAELQAGRCQACQLQLTPVAVAAIRAAKSDELLRCEDCRAILVRTAEAGI